MLGKVTNIFKVFTVNSAKVVFMYVMNYLVHTNTKNLPIGKRYWRSCLDSPFTFCRVGRCVCVEGGGGGF